MRKRTIVTSFMLMVILSLCILQNTKSGIAYGKTVNEGKGKFDLLSKYENNELNESVTKERLYYLLYTEGDSKLEKDRDSFVRDLQISNQEYEKLCKVASDNRNYISKLDHSDIDVKLRNANVLNALYKSEQFVAELLGKRYAEYQEWMDKWWKIEQGIDRTGGNLLKAAGDSKNKVHVYATQFDAETTNEVALPDKYLKFATLGWNSEIPKKLRKYYNKKFSVSVLYKSTKLIGIPVRDVGPWNTNDNYWDKKDADNPRRKFKDLNRYVPEAQAAYSNKYNNKKDESGRIVTNPAGIDLCLTVAKKLGFSKNASHWVDVDMSELP